MLRSYFEWWCQQLAALLPWHLAGGQSPRRALLVELPRQMVAPLCLTLRQRRAERSLGTCLTGDAGVPAMRRALRLAGRLPVVVKLPAGALLEREIMLPLAAEQDAAGALRHEMDRVTPFRADDVHWSWEVLRRDRAQGRLHLRIVLVPRALVDRALALLAAAGATAGLLEGRNAQGDWRGITVAQASRPAWQGQALTVGAALCATLAVGVLATPLVQQSLRRAEVEHRIAALQPRLREVAALQRQVALQDASGEAVTAALAEFGNVLRVVAAITDILPDDTFLTDLVLKQRQLALRGQSANAARLIAALSSDTTIRNPAFAAPVTRAGTGGPDIFAISAEAVP